MNDNTQTLTVHDLNWKRIRDHILDTLDGKIRPATWEEIVDAIEATHPDDNLPMGVVETATSEGILSKRGEGLNDKYAFNLSTFDDEEEEPENLHITENGRQYAPSMVTRDSWLLYEDGEKEVKAPWKTGNLFNADWGMQLDADEYPETDFETAQRWSEMAVEMGVYGSDEVNEVFPGFLLQREVLPPSENIAMIDLDDCRDPETGIILDEAQDIIDRADSYTEVSMSGAGVHIFVFGTLPDWFPAKRLVESMHTDEQPVGEQPKVEIYHRRRIAITTGDHIEATPDDLRDGHALIEELCEEYYDDDRTVEEIIDTLNESETVNESEYASNGHSPYFDVDPVTLLSSGSYRQVGSRVQGPHPHHGSSGGTDYESGGRNFAVQNDVWTCYRHGSGGNALHLVAVFEDFLNCSDTGAGCLDKLSDVAYTRLCLIARDDYTGFHGKPPYRALLGLAKSEGLAPESADKFEYGLKDLLTQMYEGASEAMLMETH